MKPNLIILTSGLTGSSVLTGLISQAGYWTGDTTHKKYGMQGNEQYNTYENRELIDLNIRLLRAAGYEGNISTDFSPDLIDRVTELAGSVDVADYRAFLDKCNLHSPWIWKDPRLWVTIRFWNRLTQFTNCRFILLTRGLVQCWVSSTLRRQIRTYRHLKSYETSIANSIASFLEANHLPILRMQYEELILNPAPSIRTLNEYLSSELTLADLQKVYTKPLYRVPRG